MRQKPPKEQLVLDKFSQTDLATWTRQEAALQQYIVRFFYHLEGYRSLHHENLCKALKDSETISINNARWVRTVDYKYSDKPLSAKGSLKQGKRFNIGADLSNFSPFAALYVAEDEDTVHKERFGTPKVANILSADELALRKRDAYAFLNLRVNLGSVFDLTKASNLKVFTEIIAKFQLTKELRRLAREARCTHTIIRKTGELKTALLEPDWILDPMQHDLPSNSQIFGRFLNAAGFSGVLYPSVRAAGKNCIAIFVQNFSDTDYVELVDAPPAGVKFTRMSADNWEQVLE